MAQDPVVPQPIPDVCVGETCASSVNGCTPNGKNCVPCPDDDSADLCVIDVDEGNAIDPTSGLPSCDNPPTPEVQPVCDLVENPPSCDSPPTGTEPVCDEVNKAKKCLQPLTGALQAPNPECFLSSGPELTVTSFASDNAKDTALARDGDLVTLTFTSSEPISNVLVDFTVGSDATTYADIPAIDASAGADGTEWSAHFMAAATDDGEVSFEIEYTYEGATQTATPETDDLVTVDNALSAPTISFPDASGGVVTATAVDDQVSVELAPMTDVDRAESILWYSTMPGERVLVDLTANTDDPFAFDVPFFRGRLTVTLEGEDAAGNVGTTTAQVDVVPFSDVMVAVSEGLADAADEVRYFGTDQERTYTVSVTHSGGAEKVESVLVEFDAEGLYYVSVAAPHDQVAQVAEDGGSVVAILLEPFQVSGTTDASAVETFEFTVGNFFLADPTTDSVAISVQALNRYGNVLADATTTAVGDQVPPAVPTLSFPADSDQDGTIDRNEYFAADNKVLLSATGLSDGSGSGVEHVDVHSDDVLVASAELPDEDTALDVELALGDLQPGNNDLVVTVVDGAGNGQPVSISIIVAVEQFIKVTPGTLYVQPDATGTLSFSLEQEGVVETVTKYALPVRFPTGTDEGVMEAFGVQSPPDPTVYTSRGAVSKVVYDSPPTPLNVVANVLAHDVADGTNELHLDVFFDPANADFRVVDQDYNDFTGPLAVVTVDGTPPVLHDATASDEVVDASEAPDGFTILASVTEANPYTVTVLDASDAVVGTSGGEAILIDTSTLASGTYTYTVEVVDAAGNPAADTVDVTVTVDKDLPTISLDDLNGLGGTGPFQVGAADAPTNELVFTSTVADMGSGVSSVAVLLNGVEQAANDGSAPIAVPLPADTDPSGDPLPYSVMVTDGAGNHARVAVEVHVDTTAPALAFTAIAEDADGDLVIRSDEQVDGTLTFTYTADDGAGSGVASVALEEYDANADAWTPLVSNAGDADLVLTLPAAGPHTYRLASTDGFGNVATTAALDVLVVGDAAVAVDAQTDDASLDGVLDHTETGTSWDVEVTGSLVPADGAGCPCTYSLDLDKDGTLVETRTGALADSQVVVESLALTGAADGTYTATVALLSQGGEVLATATDSVDVAVQPRVTAFTATLDADAGREIAGTTEPSNGQESEPVTAGFTLDSTRAGLDSAAIVSPLGYTTSAQGTLSNPGGLTIPIATTGGASGFTLDLDSTGDAPHGATETFSLAVAGVSGLTALVDVDASFGFRFDKAVDAVDATAAQSDFGEVTVDYTVLDADFGLATAELFVDGATAAAQTVSFSGETTEQVGSFVVTGLADGGHDFEVVVTDGAGNTLSDLVSVVINDDAAVTVQVLQDGTDRMDGSVVIGNDQWEGLTLRVSNAAGEPTVAKVHLDLGAGASSVADATGWGEATTGTGGVYQSLTFLLDVPAGTTVDHAFSLRATSADAQGTWTVSAETVDDYPVSSVNEGIDTLVIRTPEAVTPTVAVSAQQGGVDLVDSAGTLFATADQATHGELDDSDAVAFTVTVTDGVDPIEGATVTVPELSLSAATDAAGVAAFTVDPDDHGLDFAASDLTFRVAAQDATRGGTPVSLAAVDAVRTLLWTGFHVDVTGDDVAPTPGSLDALGETTLDADAYWLHDVLQPDGSIDLTGATPVTLGVDAALGLTESVGGQAHLTADQTGLDAEPFTVARGSITTLDDAGYRSYDATLGGILPNGVGAVYSTQPHAVLFTGFRLVFDGVDSVGFSAQEATVRAQWLHTTALDGTTIDRFDLGSDVIALTSSVSGALGDLEAATGNTLTDAPALAAGVNGLTYTGTHASLTVFPATTQMLRLEVAFGATPADAVVPVGDDYAGSFTATVNGDPVHDTFVVPDQTLTTTVAGQSASSVTFQGLTLDLSQVAVLLDGSPVTATSTYDSANSEWDLAIDGVSAGTHTLRLDLDLGNVGSTVHATTVSDEFVVTQSLYTVSLTGAPDADDASDLSSIWVDRDAGTVTLEFLVEQGDWDGATLTGATPATDGTVVQVWALTDGTWTALGTHTLASGTDAGTGSYALPGFAADAAGVKEVRIVVVESAAAQAFPATEGRNANTVEGETSVAFTGITVAVAEPTPATVLAGGNVVLDVTATFDHDGSPVEALEVTVSGTGVGSAAVLTADGTAQATLSSASLLKVADAAASVTDAAPAHGLEHHTGDAVATALRWVEVKVSSIAFEVSSDGATFTAADPADVDEATNTLTTTPGTYVRVLSTVVLDDGSTAPPTADGGVLEYNGRSVSLDGSGEGFRTYYSSASNNLPVSVAIASATLGDAAFTGGTGDDFTVVWQ